MCIPPHRKSSRPDLKVLKVLKVPKALKNPKDLRPKADLPQKTAIGPHRIAMQPHVVVFKLGRRLHLPQLPYLRIPSSF